MPGVWDSRLVTTTARLPEDLVSALLESGAKAVLCAAPDAAAAPTEAAVAYFEALYRQLLSNVPLAQVRNREWCPILVPVSNPRVPLPGVPTPTDLFVTDSPCELQRGGRFKLKGSHW